MTLLRLYLDYRKRGCRMSLALRLCAGFIKRQRTYRS